MPPPARVEAVPPRPPSPPTPEARCTTTSGRATEAAANTFATQAAAANAAHRARCGRHPQRHCRGLTSCAERAQSTTTTAAGPAARGAGATHDAGVNGLPKGSQRTVRASSSTTAAPAAGSAGASRAAPGRSRTFNADGQTLGVSDL